MKTNPDELVEFGKLETLNKRRGYVFEDQHGREHAFAVYVTRSPKKDSRTRIGDIVKIITPRRFIRVGYALTVKNTIPVLDEKFKNEINEFLIKLGIRGEPHSHRTDRIGETIHPRLEEKFMRTLAYCYIGSHGFGSKERQIFTEKLPAETVGLYGIVAAIKNHKTGTYFAPWGGQDYYGEYDYEPGGLKNSKNHKIIWFQELTGDRLNKDKTGHFEGWIENVCVEKVLEPSAYERY